jgi:hypothetical protein
MTPFASQLRAALADGIPTAQQTCGTKRRYGSRVEASGVNGHDGFKLSVYRCPVCCGFHLTKRLQSNGHVSLAEMAF